MSHCAAAISRSLSCFARASTSSCQRWSLSDGCTVFNEQQRGGKVSPVWVIERPAGCARGGIQTHCPWTSRKCCTPGLAVEKASKTRSRVVRCQEGGGGSNFTIEDWTKKLPAKRKALYSHSLPCIEAWLSSLGFVQVKEDRAVWTIERPDWHAQLSLDVTDLYIRYLKKGPGNLDRDIERKFSYALSREDLENAILGGP